MTARFSRRALLVGGSAAIFGAASGWAAERAFALIAPDAALPLAALPANAPMAAYALRSAQRWLDRKPQPMPLVHTEGTLPHQGIYDSSQVAKRDWQATLELALAARLTGESKFASAARGFIQAWLGIYKPSFNPIDETDLDRVFLAFDLLLPAERAALAGPFARFAQAMASGYLDLMPKLKGGTATNNWQSHRVKLATLGAFATGDGALIARARNAFFKQLADNIRADGSTLDFEERDALHYVVYDLEPLLVAALAAKTHGEDWFGEAKGKALARALLWLAPYAQGKQTHQEFVRSKVDFDAKRAAAGLSGFSGTWQKEEADDVFAVAARLDSQFAPLAKALLPGFEGTRRPHSPWLHLVLPI